LAVSSPSLSTPSDNALALKAQFARDALRAELAGDTIKAKIARDSSRLVAWMDSMPGEALLIELFGYSAHVFAWTDHCREVGRSFVRKGKRRHHQRPLRPPDGLHTASEAAVKLRCSVKTLNGYVAAGALKYVIIGHGMKRPRKMFTAADLDEFIAAQTRKDVPCPSSARSARHTGISTSNTEVIGFTARRNARLAAKPKK
jgi:hypothetical protein